MTNAPRIGGIYRHYQGGRYVVTALGRLEADGSQVVVYQDLDLGSVFDAARETGTALEINGALPRLDPPIDALKQARDVTFLLTSDAHQTSELQLVEFAARHAQRAQLPLSQIANGWDGERLRAWLHS